MQCNAAEDRRRALLTKWDAILIDLYKEASEKGKRKYFLALLDNPQRERINEIVNFLHYGTKLDHNMKVVSSEQQKAIKELYYVKR